MKKVEPNFSSSNLPFCSHAIVRKCRKSQSTENWLNYCMQAPPFSLECPNLSHDIFAMWVVYVQVHIAEYLIKKPDLVYKSTTKNVQPEWFIEKKSFLGTIEFITIYYFRQTWIFFTEMGIRSTEARKISFEHIHTVCTWFDSFWLWSFQLSSCFIVPLAIAFVIFDLYVYVYIVPFSQMTKWNIAVWK